MNAHSNPTLRKTLIALMLAGVAFTSVPLYAQDSDVEDEIMANLQRDGDNAIRTLKTGQKTQKRHMDGSIENLEPETRALVTGETPEAAALRETGRHAQHRRQHPRRMEAFENLEAQHAPRHGPHADVETLARHPDEMNRVYRAGASAQAHHRGAHHAHGAADTHQTHRHTTHGHDTRDRGHASRAHGGTHAPAHSGAPRTAHVHADVDAPRSGGGRTRAGGAGGVAGATAGWALETATGVHMPDEMEAAKWFGDTMQRPQDMHKRVGELAHGGVHMAGQFATSLARPDRMAENVVNGGVGLVKTGAYMVTHPKYAVTTAGNTVVAVGNTAVGVGTGLVKGTYAVGKAGVNAIAHPDKTINSVGKGITKAGNSAAKTINKAGCSVGKLFKPSSRC